MDYDWPDPIVSLTTRNFPSLTVAERPDPELKSLNRERSVLGIHRLPTPVALHKDISPEVVSAGVSAFVRTLFMLVTGYHRDVSEHANFHVQDGNGFELVVPGLESSQMLSFRLRAQGAQVEPIIAEQWSEGYRVLVFVCVGPYVLDFSKLLFNTRLTLGFRFFLTISGLASSQQCSHRSEQHNR